MTEERRPWQDMPEWNPSPLDIESLNQAHVETAEATWTGRGWCNGCMQRWPCTTRQLLRLLEKADAQATELERDVCEAPDHAACHRLGARVVELERVRDGLLEHIEKLTDRRGAWQSRAEIAETALEEAERKVREQQDSFLGYNDEAVAEWQEKLAAAEARATRLETQLAVFTALRDIEGNSRPLASIEMYKILNEAEAKVRATEIMSDEYERARDLWRTEAGKAEARATAAEKELKAWKRMQPSDE